MLRRSKTVEEPPRFFFWKFTITAGELEVSDIILLPTLEDWEPKWFVTGYISFIEKEDLTRTSSTVVHVILPNNTETVLRYRNEKELIEIWRMYESND